MLKATGESADKDATDAENPTMQSPEYELSNTEYGEASAPHYAESGTADYNQQPHYYNPNR